MDKQTLRKFAKEKRESLDIEKISSYIIEKLIQTEVYKSSKNIMIYYPLEREINLIPLLNDASKQFYLPRIKGKELECCNYSLGDELSTSSFKTKEPVCQACSHLKIDTIIVPALACDKNGYRLGYGGGFYDRFLSKTKTYKICCIPSELIFDSVFPEKHDIKMDLIITENLLLEFFQ